MKNISKRIPEGMRDILFSDLEAKRGLERRLSDFFKSRGFSEISTPTLEYYDAFTSGDADLPQESLYKLVDNSGKLLVIRPDSTVPAARIAATKLHNSMLPLRFCYNQSTFVIKPTERGKLNEITQAGIEMIGASGIKADIECLVTAAKALSTCFDGTFRIELGHVGFFKAIVQSVTDDEAVIESIRTLIEQKNFAALNDILAEIEQSACETVKRGCAALRRLPQLFGDRSVLSEAKLLIENKDASEALDYLSKLYDKLTSMGMSELFTFDLGLVTRIDYYTGIIFRGYISTVGGEIMSGGRYDGLLSQFCDKDIEAIGFAIDIDAVCEILVKDSEPDICPPDYLIFYEEGNEAKAYTEADRLTARGKTVEMAVFDTLEQAEAYAASKGIKKVTTV